MRNISRVPQDWIHHRAIHLYFDWFLFELHLLADIPLQSNPSQNERGRFLCVGYLVAATSAKEFKKMMTARIEKALSRWKSADKSARLEIVQVDLKKACKDYDVANQLSKFIERRPVDEVKQLLGAPDTIDKGTRRGGETFLYFLGSTTKATKSPEREVLAIEINSDGKAKGAYLEQKQLLESKQHE